jgi:hypothetical protein
LREIAERMGVAISTVEGYLNDPDGARLQARKASYAAACESCGGPTNGSGGRVRQARRCRACIEWPDEAIIDAIRRWADAHDGVPPRIADWRFGAVDHPSSQPVRARIGWNHALALAGFKPHIDRSPERQAWIVEQLRAGRRASEIAGDLGLTVSAIYGRLKVRGLTMAQVRNS